MRRMVDLPPDRVIRVWVDEDGDTIEVVRSQIPKVDSRPLLRTSRRMGAPGTFLPSDPVELDALLTRIRAAALDETEET